MNGRKIKKSIFVREADGRLVKKSTRVIGFDENRVEVEEINEQLPILGCGHQGDPSGWCCCCDRSLCAKCSTITCWVCGRVCCSGCTVEVWGHKSCRRCRTKAFWLKLWREGL